MKKNLMAVAAVFLAITMCSFEKKPSMVDVYMLFNGNSAEKDFDNYGHTWGHPGEFDNFGTLTLAWARFSDNDGYVYEYEFDSEFEALDITNSGADKLSDEFEDHNTIELF